MTGSWEPNNIWWHQDLSHYPGPADSSPFDELTRWARATARPIEDIKEIMLHMAMTYGKIEASSFTLEWNNSKHMASPYKSRKPSVYKPPSNHGPRPSKHFDKKGRRRF